MRNSFLKDFYKVNPSLDPDKQPEKPADNNDDNSMRESMEDIKAGFDAMKQELADTRAELSKYINQQQPADNVDNSNNVDNNEGGADNAS
jgi:hypothetical protein